jgi:hypothetical protein
LNAKELIWFNITLDEYKTKMAYQLYKGWVAGEDE